MGSTLSPASAQLAGVMQGVAGAGVPPEQKNPTAHCVALAGETDPAAHPLPGAALQAPEQMPFERPTEAPKYPAKQGRQVEAEETPVWLLYVPAAQGRQEEGALENVPAGHVLDLYTQSLAP